MGLGQHDSTWPLLPHPKPAQQGAEEKGGRPLPLLTSLLGGVQCACPLPGDISVTWFCCTVAPGCAWLYTSPSLPTPNPTPNLNPNLNPSHDSIPNPYPNLNLLTPILPLTQSITLTQTHIQN